MIWLRLLNRRAPKSFDGKAGGARSGQAGRGRPGKSDIASFDEGATKAVNDLICLFGAEAGRAAGTLLSHAGGITSVFSRDSDENSREETRQAARG